MEGKILIVDDDKKILKLCHHTFGRQGYEVTVAENAEEAIKKTEKEVYDLALVDIVMPRIDGIELLKMLRKKDQKLLVIMITGFPQIQSAVEAIKQGAYDYIAKPFSLDEIRLIVKRAFNYKNVLKENSRLKEELQRKYRSNELIGSSPKMQEIYRIIEKVSATDCTILIEGESGTGKEVVARTIHRSSNRSDKPFMSINCGALPETLLESELFGYERGAFTGAVKSKKGLFEAANEGTVFLDEIAETSPAMQVKLLHILDNKISRRVGSTKDISLDIRLIAATNKNPLHESQKGNFREDLYYRLKIVSILMPPLRDKKQDIPVLIRHFINRYNIKYNKECTRFADDAMALLMKYDYPGNVRELENIVESAVICSVENVIQKSVLSEIIQNPSMPIIGEAYNLEEVEKRHILQALEYVNYNKTKAAGLLHIDRKTLYQKIKKYKLPIQ